MATRWENVTRLGGEVRAPSVAREFRHQESLDDLFAPSAGHSTSRLIDYVALEWRHHVFIADVTDAFGDIKWGLLKQLYGRRRTGQQWVDFVAAQLARAGFVRCDAAPQFFYHVGWRLAIEVHTDDLHGAGPPPGMQRLTDVLSETVKSTEWSVMISGGSYMHLKRLRELADDHTALRPNGKERRRCWVSATASRHQRPVCRGTSSPARKTTRCLT